MYTMAQKVLHAVFDDPEGTLLNAAAVLGCGIAGVEQSEVLRDKEIIEEQLKKERGRYETLLDMRMNNEIPKEVFSRKQQEVGGWGADRGTGAEDGAVRRRGARHGGRRERQAGKPAKAHGAVHHAGGWRVFGRGNG